MRIVLRIALMVSLAATAYLAVACQPAPAPEPEIAAPSDEELLRTLVSDFSAAWARNDAAAVAALFAEDGDILTANGHSQGRSALEETYRQNFEGPFNGTSLALEMTSVRFLQPDVAVTDGTYELTGLKGPDGEDLPSSKGLWTDVNVKADDGWLIGCARPMIPVESPEIS